MKLKLMVIVTTIVASSLALAQNLPKHPDDAITFGLMGVQKTSLDKFVKKLGGVLEGEGYKYTLNDKQQGEVAFTLDKPISKDAAMTYILDTVHYVFDNSSHKKKSGGSDVMIKVTPISQPKNKK